MSSRSVLLRRASIHDRLKFHCDQRSGLGDRVAQIRHPAGPDQHWVSRSPLPTRGMTRGGDPWVIGQISQLGVSHLEDINLNQSGPSWNQGA